MEGPSQPRLSSGPLHVPLTSTPSPQIFGTVTSRVNQLASRMLDSALDNIGTTRAFWMSISISKAGGPLRVAFSASDSSWQAISRLSRFASAIETSEGYREVVTVGACNPESLSLGSLNIPPGRLKQFR